MIIDNLVGQSVEVNDLIIPASAVESHLGKYSTHLCVWTHDDTYKVRLVGTAIPILFRGHYLLVCTRHQLADVDPKDVSILFPDGSYAVTSSGVRFFNHGYGNSETDAYDIAVFEFSEPCKEHPNMKKMFYNFSCIPPNDTTDKIIALIVAGYPSEDQLYEIDEKNHIGSVKRILTALPDEQPSDQSLLRAKFVNELEFDPDGLSGGPVFVVQLVGDAFVGYLAGMVLRSGKKKMHFLKVGFIKSFLEAFVEKRP